MGAKDTNGGTFALVYSRAILKDPLGGGWLLRVARYKVPYRCVWAILSPRSLGGGRSHGS